MPTDSIVNLFFDGLEIIYFPEKDPHKAVVLLLKEGSHHHVPTLNILKNGMPLLHNLDISQGLTIKLEESQGAGPSDDGSFDQVLNPQNETFHAGHLRFKPGLSGRTIKVEIWDGEFFASPDLTTDKFPTRFEVSNPLGNTVDTDPYPFADVVGASITLSDGNPLVISDGMEDVPLEYDPAGAIYTVCIFNIPNGHLADLPKPLTHFHFYYDVLEDNRAIKPKFDLNQVSRKNLPSVIGRVFSVFPQNCDPITLYPPPPDDGGGLAAASSHSHTSSTRRSGGKKSAKSKTGGKKAAKDKKRK